MEQHGVDVFTINNWVMRRLCNFFLLFVIFTLSVGNRHFPGLVGGLFLVAIAYNILYADYNLIKSIHVGTIHNKIYLSIYISSTAIVVLCLLWINYIETLYTEVGRFHKGLNKVQLRIDYPYLDNIGMFTILYILSFLFLPPLGYWMPRREKRQVSEPIIPETPKETGTL